MKPASPVILAVVLLLAVCFVGAVVPPADSFAGIRREPSWKLVARQENSSDSGTDDQGGSSSTARKASEVQKDVSKGYPSRGLTRDWSQDNKTFYDAPKLVGRGKWRPAIVKAQAMVEKLTLKEIVGLMTGVGWQLGPQPSCVGDIAPIPRVKFPGLCLSDGPLGIRFADLVTSYPTGVSTAATFSKELAYHRGKAMGQEFRLKGVNIMLGPAMNLARVAAGGRNWESGSADPWHLGAMVAATVRGVQSQGVQANAKHYMANEQEILRHAYSSNIDDRTSREIYEHPFLMAVQAGVATIMCSYNLVNGTWACQNDELLNKRLKTEMGFSGAVISDWGAQHSGVASALAGLDQTQPGQTTCCSPDDKSSWWGPNLTLAVNNGSVPMERVKDAATRILASWYLLGQDEWGPTKVTNWDAFDPNYGTHLNAMNEERRALAREIGAAGTVLLRNEKKTLPLKYPRKIAIVGSDAGPAHLGANFFRDRAGLDGVVGMGWGSGSTEYATLVSPYEALHAKARSINAGFYWSFDDYNLEQAKMISDENQAVDAAIVFVHSDSGEGYITIDRLNEGDRNNLTLWANGNELIQAVASVNSRTIVVIHAPGQIDLEAFIEHPNVTAVVMAHMPGQEAGNAIADILFGDVNPSGRLPYTIAKRRTDYPADVHYFPGMNNTAAFVGQANIDYNEGLNVDYRHFDAKNITPRYEFGYGLSYTTFKYSNLRGKWLSEQSWNERTWSWPLPEWINEDAYEVSFDVENSGHVDGFEVPQLYIGFPKSAHEPPKVLRDFGRVEIKAGTTRTVKFTLSRYDLSIWSTEKQRWWKPQGATKLFVGASSRDIRLTMDKI